jgi:hypothetical protein
MRQQAEGEKAHRKELRKEVEAERSHRLQLEQQLKILSEKVTAISNWGNDTIGYIPGVPDEDGNIGYIPGVPDEDEIMEDSRKDTEDDEKQRLLEVRLF